MHLHLLRLLHAAWITCPLARLPLTHAPYPSPYALALQAFAVWKINAMGLLPTNLSDWVSSMRPPTALEHALPNLLQ